MKNYQRALRRHHRKRLQKKRSHYWNSRFLETNEAKSNHLKYIINTTKRCSCFMCGNPRKFFKEKTVQEKRQLSSFMFQLS